jgi:hypothetical protein
MNQAYGWREPIDDIGFGYGLKSTVSEFFSNISFRKPEKEATGAKDKK